MLGCFLSLVIEWVGGQMRQSPLLLLFFSQLNVSDYIEYFVLLTVQMVSTCSYCIFLDTI
jgi:hypothetical protein